MMLARFKENKKIFSSILECAPKIRPYILISIVLYVVVIAVNLATPILYKLFIDDVILGGKIEKLAVVIIGYLLSFIISSLTEYLNCQVRLKYENIITVNIKLRVLDYYLSLQPFDYYSLDIGEAKMKIEDDIEKIKNHIDTQVISPIISVISVTASVILMLLIDWRLTIYSVIVIPLTIIMNTYMGKKEKIVNEKRHSVDQTLSGWLQKSLNGWKDIRAFGIEKSQERQYVKYLNEQALLFGVWINYWTVRVLILPLISNTILAKCGFYLFGGILIINGKIKIGSILTFSQYYERLFSSINSLAQLNADMISNTPYYDRVLHALNEVETFDNKINKLVSCNQILLQNVSFRYECSDRDVLKNVNFSIEKGDWVAVVGESGSGKSTLIKIISGLISPSNGAVKYDNADLSGFNIDELCELRGLVLQELTLFNGTIRENLKYGKNDADDNELIDVCKATGIIGEDSQFPDGLDTDVGECGTKLSAGQRQRVGLARTFLKSHSIYIFDESTGNLDIFSENKILCWLKHRRPDSIVIIITHRKSTQKFCNKVITLENQQCKVINI